MNMTPARPLKTCLLTLREWLKRPVAMRRSEAELKALSRELCGLTLYHHPRCPASIKTYRAVRQLNLPLECQDIRRSQVYRDDLLAGIGRLEVPVLRVKENGTTFWLTGGDDVLNYLQARFSRRRALDAV